MEGIFEDQMEMAFPSNPKIVLEENIDFQLGMRMIEIDHYFSSKRERNKAVRKLMNKILKEEGRLKNT